jgi:hypothetical protein
LFLCCYETCVVILWCVCVRARVRVSIVSNRKLMIGKKFKLSSSYYSDPIPTKFSLQFVTRLVKIPLCFYPHFDNCKDQFIETLPLKTPHPCARSMGGDLIIMPFSLTLEPRPCQPSLSEAWINSTIVVC